MRNILKIVRRDVLRLFKAPAALIVAVAMLVLPSLYTWYNVVAFWNPYECTGNLAVNVVNEDAGAETDLTGTLNVGDKLMEQLAVNDKMKFIEEDRETAMANLEAGRVYAVFIVPENFSEYLISPLTGEIKSPKITYIPNEKLGPVSPKITDTAASTLDETINSAFVATVSDAAVNAIANALTDVEGDVSDAQSKTKMTISEVKSTINGVHRDLLGIQNATDNAQKKISTAIDDMNESYDLVTDSQTLLNDISEDAEAVQSSLKNASAITVDSFSDVLDNVSQIAVKASTATSGFAAEAGAAQSRVDLAMGRITPIVTALSNLADDLRSAADTLSDDSEARQRLLDVASELDDRSNQLQSLANAASELSGRITDAANTAANAASSLKDSSQDAANALQNLSSDLYGGGAPTIIESLGTVSTACANVSGAIQSLSATIDQAKASLEQLNSILGDCGSAVKRTDELIGGIQTDLNSITTDVNLLTKSGFIADLVNRGDLNAENISAFMESPTQIEKVEFYHPNAYGTAMAPLFMNLTFWIGAFMLVIIFRTEADDEGVPKVKPYERYLGRLMFFSGFAILQALICCAGVLVLGVQAANPPALFFAAALTSLAFLGLIYALSTTLQHIGKALCIVLVFAQIPGGSGLYPLELTDGFFQAIYPFLPFSYGIDAMREGIGGFYGAHYVTDLAVLALIFVSMTAIGIALVPSMSNVTHMVSRQVKEGDLYNGGDAIAPARPFRISQVVSALSDREDFRADLEQRYERFNRMYPAFIRTSIVLSICVPAALGLLLALNAAEKVVLLTILLLALVALVVFLVVVESLRYSFERQMNIENMSSDYLVSVFFDRNRFATDAVGDDIVANAKHYGILKGRKGARVKPIRTMGSKVGSLVPQIPKIGTDDQAGEPVDGQMNVPADELMDEPVDELMDELLEDADQPEPQASPAKPQANSAEPEASPAETQSSPAEPQASPAEPQASPAEPQASPAEPQAIQNAQANQDTQAHPAHQHGAAHAQGNENADPDGKEATDA